MTVFSKSEISEKIQICIKKIAPEVNFVLLKPAIDLRAQVDLDSVDFMRFLTLLHSELHIDIPESEYSKVSTLENIIDYLFTHQTSEAE